MSRSSKSIRTFSATIRHAEQRALRRDVVDPRGPPRLARALQPVVDQESVLQRRAGAFHLGLGPREDAAPAPPR